MSEYIYTNRRDFSRKLAAVAAAPWIMSPVNELWGQTNDKPAADRLISGKDKRLVVHNTTVAEIETPLPLLREHSLTPKELLFVRNNQQLPNALTIEPASTAEGNVEFSGSIDMTRSIPIRELIALEATDVEMVLQCSGNSRSRFEQSVKAEGVPWKHGAMGNIVMRGVRLSEVIKHFQMRIADNARFVTVEGADLPSQPGTADFEHSIPLTDALDRSLLVFQMNNEPLPRVHGGPLRFVTPGYYGTMNVKWLSKIRFEERESTNHHHEGRYRTPLKEIAPGTAFKSTLANSEANWNMRIKSVIFGPLEGQTVGAGLVDFHGVAWNDGQARIETVELSIDQGRSWHATTVQKPKSPYAWHPWKVTLQLRPGHYTVWSRASDANGRTQPLDQSSGWNPAGYAWHSVDAVSFHAF